MIQIKNTIVDKVKTFCQHSTLHGLYYFYSNTRWWVHGVWALIMGLSIALCCFLSQMIWQKFITDPTLTVVETTHFSTADVPFPAVAVCDTDVYGPNTKEITKLLTLRGYNLSQIYEFYKSFSKIKHKDYAPEPYVRKMHFLLEDLGYPLKLLNDILKKPCEDLISECVWRSRVQNCSNMFRPVFTITGHCCQFDIPYFRQHADKDTNFLSGVEVTEALDIIVKGQKETADGNTSNGNALLYVFDGKDKVTLLDSAITLTPGAYFDVNVYLWAIDSSTNFKSLSRLNRKCILDTDPGNRVSSYQGCMTQLILKEVVEQCRCLPFDFTSKELSVEDYPACTWDRLSCIHQTIEKVKVDIRVIIGNNECYQRCDYVQYETEVEYIKNDRVVRESEDSLSRVSVHFSETTCIKYRREVLYTWDQMLANLGGIFGLCLGGSIISVIEIIWFFLDLIFAVIASLRKKNITPKENNGNKIFTIKQRRFSRKNVEVKRPFLH